MPINAPVRGLEGGSLRGQAYEDVSLTASVGWVIYPNDAQSVDELIAAADFCLRGAKLTGKDRALSALDWAPDLAA